MKCKKFRQQNVLYLYGELGPREKSELERHLKDCPSCSEDLEYTRQVFLAVDQAEDSVPEVNWDHIWNRMRAGMRQPGGPSQRIFAFPRWVPAAASLFLIFCLGWFIGRAGRTDVPPESASPEVSSEFILGRLQEHFDNLRPLLIEYANYNNGGSNGIPVTVDENLLQGLLIQNYLLMKIIAKNDSGAAQILDDIELVLREITNREEGDRQSFEMIKNLISQREILFKLEVFKKL